MSVLHNKYSLSKWVDEWMVNKNIIHFQYWFPNQGLFPATHGMQYFIYSPQIHLITFILEMNKKNQRSIFLVLSNKWYKTFLDHKC